MSPSGRRAVLAGCWWRNLRKAPLGSLGLYEGIKLKRILKKGNEKPLTVSGFG